MDDFADHLRQHRLMLQRRADAEKPGSRVWFKLDAAMRATEALYLEAFRAPIDPVHSQPPYRGL